MKRTNAKAWGQFVVAVLLGLALFSCEKEEPVTVSSPLGLSQDRETASEFSRLLTASEASKQAVSDDVMMFSDGLRALTPPKVASVEVLDRSSLRSVGDTTNHNNAHRLFDTTREHIPFQPEGLLRATVVSGKEGYYQYCLSTIMDIKPWNQN